MKKKFFVIGNPIDHSLSPKLHNYWIKKYKIDAVYEKKLLNNNEIDGLIFNIREEKIHGINITVPFKKKVIPFLDELSEEAEISQSVNTIYKKDNKIIGDNTDIEGFKLSLEKTEQEIKNKKALILGAGGVVSSIIIALKKMQIEKIYCFIIYFWHNFMPDKKSFLSLINKHHFTILCYSAILFCIF